MRLPVSLPIALLAGFGVGLALVRGPARIAPPVVAAAGETSRAGETVADADSPAATEAKLQRLITAALRKGRRIDCDEALYLAVEDFTAADFRRLLADTAGLKLLGEKLRTMNYLTRRALPSALIARWLAVDADAALAAVPQLLDLFSKKDGDRGLLLDALAAKRPLELLALVPAQKDAAGRAEIISRALRELAQHDPAKAREWFAACTDAEDRRVAEKAMRLGAVQADPLRAVELAAALEDRQEIRELLSTAAERAGKLGAGVLRQLATTPMQPWMLSSLLRELAGRDPLLAVDLAVKSATDNGNDFDGLQTAFAAFARRDSAQAIAKLEGLTGRARAVALGAIGSEWAEREPTAALAWLAARPKSERTNPNGGNFGTSDSFLMAFGEWAARAPGEARAWADAQPAGADRDGVQAQIARALAERGDSAEATKILARLGPAADLQAVREVASTWARRDPRAAADWAIAQEPGRAQNSALTGIVGAWGNDDPRAVENWLAQFPAGEARDRSINAFLERNSVWTTGNAERAAEFEAWFDLIDDPWQRTQAARSSFWERQRRDPVAARAWLSAQPDLDPELVRMTLRDNPN